MQLPDTDGVGLSSSKVNRRLAPQRLADLQPLGAHSPQCLVDPAGDGRMGSRCEPKLGHLLIVPTGWAIGNPSRIPCGGESLRLSVRFEQALVLAAQTHSTQIRKGSTVPYISHLLMVAALVLDHGGDEDASIAALLHDAVEDQGGAPVQERITGLFGGMVGSIVAACTDSSNTPKPPWRERKEAHLRRVAELLEGDDPLARSVRLVLAADKLANATTILSDYRIGGETIWNRFKGGKEGTLWYYRSMSAAVRHPSISPLSFELDRVVTALEAASTTS
jgi:HD domain